MLVQFLRDPILADMFVEEFDLPFGWCKIRWFDGPPDWRVVLPVLLPVMVLLTIGCFLLIRRLIQKENEKGSGGEGATFDHGKAHEDGAEV